MRSDPRAAAIASGIIDLGRRLGAHTIAEGIEGASEVTELRQMGCDLGQGFHFAPGLPPAELDEQLVRSGYPVARRRRTAARRAPPARRSCASEGIDERRTPYSSARQMTAPRRGDR